MTTDPLPLAGMPRPRVCKDCHALPREQRPKGHPLKAPHPGPRCHGHHQAKRKTDREKRRENDSVKRYGMPPGFMARLIAFQGNRCGACGRKLRNYQRDHDHAAEARGEFSMRGAVCRTCNNYLGYIRDSQDAVARLLAYLERPPAQVLMDMIRLAEQEDTEP